MCKSKNKIAYPKTAILFGSFFILREDLIKIIKPVSHQIIKSTNKVKTMSVCFRSGNISVLFIKI